MTPLIVLGVGALVAAGMGLWALVARSGRQDGKDLGTISSQWINERRAHERESSSDR